MTSITSVARACCLALLLPAVAHAQVPPVADVGRSGIIGGEAIDLASRALDAKTYAAVPGNDAAVQLCRVDTAPQEPEPEDSRWKWRLRAYRHLDCVLTLVDAALRASPADAAEDTEHKPVRLSRDDVERIRTLAWWARDAAGRIGQ